MKYIRLGIIVIFIAVTIVFVVNFYNDKKSVDNTYPKIEMRSEQIEVSVKATNEDLLKDVIAKDAKDGDLTNNIVVESISKFIDKKNHICNVTYVVEDSDKNVTKATRKIKFTDYEKTQFTLSQPLCFNIGSDMSVADIIGAVDDYDGDISHKVKILSSTVSNRIAGAYTVTAQVTNSLGDTSKLKTTVVIRQSNNLSPIIDLKQNIVYLKKGQKFNAQSYIKSVRDSEGKSMDTDAVDVVSSSVNTDKSGYYTVEYAVDEEKYEDGSTYLAVVVEE